VLAAVGERRFAAVGSGDDVSGGEHEAVGGYYDAGASALHAAISTEAAIDAEVGDGGCKDFGDARDDAGVRVERIAVVAIGEGGRGRLVAADQRVDEPEIRIGPRHASRNRA
jgi:hypothetical protein